MDHATSQSLGDLLVPPPFIHASTYPTLPPRSSTDPNYSTKPAPPRTQSAPLLQPDPSAPDSEPALRRPGLGAHRSSYSSNDSSVESTIPEDEEEDEDEEIVSPALAEHPTNVMIRQPPSERTFQLVPSQSHLSYSLPASFLQQPRQPAPSQDDCSVTQELLKITKQLRDGLLSPERLTPACRIKQVGIGGRGRRHVSTSAATSTGPKSPHDARFPEPRFAQTFHEPVILRAPRAIRAWEKH